MDAAVLRFGVLSILVISGFCSPYVLHSYLKTLLVLSLGPRRTSHPPTKINIELVQESSKIKACWALRQVD